MASLGIPPTKTVDKPSPSNKNVMSTKGNNCVANDLDVPEEDVISILKDLGETGLVVLEILHTNDSRCERAKGGATCKDSPTLKSEECMNSVNTRAIQ
ncbi:hypothetical protein RJT34_11997 [Clitoria ternatea]|uniref:Uncharacterized protein n=1 Tax=Clitoria ternatea TaxID=43366 RepID=A0AAN9JMW4_CLITE